MCNIQSSLLLGLGGGRNKWKRLDATFISMWIKDESDERRLKVGRQLGLFVDSMAVGVEALMEKSTCWGCHPMLTNTWIECKHALCCSVTLEQNREQTDKSLHRLGVAATLSRHCVFCPAKWIFDKEKQSKANKTPTPTHTHTHTHSLTHSLANTKTKQKRERKEKKDRWTKNLVCYLASLGRLALPLRWRCSHWRQSSVPFPALAPHQSKRQPLESKHGP